ncbi:MAG: hypothetical protein AAF571_03390 [Verrucomicrobiota bacterium]
MATFVTGNIAYGFRDPLPLKGFPPGRTRLRIRHNDITRVYVKTDTGIRCFQVKVEDGCWVPLVEIQRNQSV